MPERIGLLLANLLQDGNWQRQQDPSAPKPALILAPGDTGPGEAFGSEPIPASQFDDWWYSDPTVDP